MLRHSLIALSEAGRTLVDLPAFLADADARRAVLVRVAHPMARERLKQFDRLSEGERRTWSEPILNKAHAFLADDRVRHLFLAPKSTFSLRAIMDGGKILLVKLPKGRLKDAADLLGSLLLAKIQMAAFSRADVPPDRRRLFYLYIDEFQNYATESFLETLAEARKYRLSLILAHQNLSQLPERLQASILANCNLQAYFRVSRRDAQILVKESLGSLRAASGGDRETYSQWLQELQPRECVIKRKDEGGVVKILTEDVVSPHEAAGMDENEFQRALAASRIGGAHLRKRSEIAALERRQTADVPVGEEGEADEGGEEFWEAEKNG